MIDDVLSRSRCRSRGPRRHGTCTWVGARFHRKICSSLTPFCCAHMTPPSTPRLQFPVFLYEGSSYILNHSVQKRTVEISCLHSRRNKSLGVHNSLHDWCYRYSTDIPTSRSRERYFPASLFCSVQNFCTLRASCFFLSHHLGADVAPNLFGRPQYQLPLRRAALGEAQSSVA